MKKVLFLLLALVLFQFQMNSQVSFHFTINSESEQQLSITEIKINGEWVNACCEHFDANGTYTCEDECNSNNKFAENSETLTEKILLSEKTFQGIKWYSMDESGDSEDHSYDYKNGQLYADESPSQLLGKNLSAIEVELRGTKGLYVRVGKGEQE